MMNPTINPAMMIPATVPGGVTPQSPALYRFHSFRVLDNAGRQVGVVDWIWADATTGHGAFVGIRQSWLWGTALAIPMDRVRIDFEKRMMRVVYSAEQIKSAQRCAIGQTLQAEQECAVWAHYDQEPTSATINSAVEGPGPRGSWRPRGAAVTRAARVSTYDA